MVYTLYSVLILESQFRPRKECFNPKKALGLSVESCTESPSLVFVLILYSSSTGITLY